MSTFCSGWYLIYTRPRHEKKVHARLEELQINSFLPTRKTLRRWHDRRKFVDEPLFPSYVFVYLNDMSNYYEGIDAEGAMYYVRSGKEIAQINESIIDNIRLAVSQDQDIEVSECRFQPGRRLVINKGALTGLSCEMVEFKGNHKLLVRVDLLQRNLLITLAENELLAI